MLRKFCIINTCGNEDCGNHEQDHEQGAYYLVQDVDAYREQVGANVRSLQAGIEQRDALLSRLVEAETALLNAMLGNANAVAAYLNKYPEPYSVE